MTFGEIYIKLVVAFPDDPKVRALARFGAPDANLARDLYVQMCLHCKEHLTDGFVPDEQLGLLVYPLSPEHGNQLAKQLASVGLIKEVSNGEAPGWQVCAFLKRNRTREDVERLSKVRAEAGHNGGVKSSKRTGQRTSKGSGKQVANQGASKKPPIVQSTESRDIDRDASNEASLFAGDSPTTRDILASFIDWDRQNGGQLTKRTIGQLAKYIGDLVSQGIGDRHIRRGLADWRASGQNPVTLDSFVNAAMKGAAPRAGAHQTYRNPENQDAYDEELRVQ